MTIQEFENKYWYMSELKALAKSLKFLLIQKHERISLKR